MVMKTFKTNSDCLRT